MYKNILLSAIWLLVMTIPYKEARLQPESFSIPKAPPEDLGEKFQKLLEDVQKENKIILLQQDSLKTLK